MEFITREIVTIDWLTLLILISLGLLIGAKVMNRSRFTYFAMLFNSNQYVTLNQKANKISGVFNGILFTFQVVSVSIFIFICWEIFAWPQPSIGIKLYLTIASLYAIFTIFKLLIEKIIGNIFALDTMIEEYLFYKMSYRNFLGLLLLPLNVLFIYSYKPSGGLILGLGILFLLLNVLVLFLFYKKNETLVITNILYFILYLCTLEIAPYFILYKLIK